MGRVEGSRGGERSGSGVSLGISRCCGSFSGFYHIVMELDGMLWIV